MGNSLLAFLYPHIRGSQEDIATLSLQYICSTSDDLNQSFTKILFKSLHLDASMDLHYECQSVGEKKERPDLSGFDASGHEKLLCEAKFYAGLTSNQPNAYIDRLIKNKGNGLVFICPVVRKENLWSSLLNLCNHRNVIEIDSFCAEVDGIRLSLITWNEILDVLYLRASESAIEMRSDINQLRGFCEKMDIEAFIPFTSEDLGAHTPQLEERYYQVLDDVFNRLMTMKELLPSAKGLKATAYRQGYARYIRIRNRPLGILYDRVFWKNIKTVETPFWLTIYGVDDKGHWYQPKSYYKLFDRYKASEKEVKDYNNICLPLFPPVNVSKEEVVTVLIKQIMTYLDDLDFIDQEY